jgi:hypothetical protein
VLSTAASGVAFPTLQVTLAYASACGADATEWRGRWEKAAAELAGQQGTGCAAGQPGPQASHLLRSGHFGCRTRRVGRPGVRQRAAERAG